MELKPGESIEDLHYKGLKIIQSADGYRFTSDAVLLAGLTEAAQGDEVVDLGTGSGVVALLLAARTGARVTGVEIQPALADRARRSVAYNGAEGRVEIVEGDMKTAYKTLGSNRFDVAASNPPYFKAENGPILRARSGSENCSGGEKFSENEGGFAHACESERSRTERRSGAPFFGYSERDVAKREIAVTLDEVCRAARALLKFGGRFYLVSKSDRLTDVFERLRAAGLEPKRLIPVQPKPCAPIDTVIVKAVKGGKPGLRFESPLLLCGEDGKPTDRAKEIYHL